LVTDVIEVGKRATTLTDLTEVGKREERRGKMEIINRE